MEGRRIKIGIFYISFSLSVHLDQHYIFGSGPYSDLVQTFILYRYRTPYTVLLSGTGTLIPITMLAVLPDPNVN